MKLVNTFTGAMVAVSLLAAPTVFTVRLGFPFKLRRTLVRPKGEGTRPQAHG